MFNTASRLMLLALGMLLIAACGQRGPLYLPENPPPNQGKKLCPTCAPVAEANTEENEADTPNNGDEAQVDKQTEAQSEASEDSPQEFTETTSNENDE